jgi:hypothetical protein
MKKMPQRGKVLNDYDSYSFDYEDIRIALQGVDGARNNLIAAQNNLVTILNRLDSDYTIQRFREFYAGGGVTAEDWEANYNSHKDRYVEPQPIKLRQLRVVGKRSLPDPVKPTKRYRLKKQPKRRPRTGLPGV